MLLTLTAGMWLLASVAPEQVGAPPAGTPSERALAISHVVADKGASSADRDTALSSLEVVDFDMAVSVAPALLDEKDRILRARAAWILAQAEQDQGRVVLRAMAAESTGESVLAIEALGRLRDPESHELLRGLLREESARARPNAGRISALTQGLGDYGESGDAALLSVAIRGGYGAGNWVMVEAVGRTGGSAAIGVLEDLFARGTGWTAMAAGLGLARCGSEKGLRYVRDRLAPLSRNPSKAADVTISNAETDDPLGPRAADFILGHLGASTDEAFLPDLIAVVSSAGAPSRARAQAWEALLRINSPRYRQEVLGYAWKNLRYEAAARLVVLNDQARARTVLGASQPEKESHELFNVRQALAATARDRRRWRETHGYAF